MQNSKISPIDIKKQTFRKAFRGYAAGEVDAFLELISQQMDTLVNENAKQRIELDHLKTQVDNYSNMENLLQKTLMNSEKFAREIEEKARKEADLIIKEAEHQVEIKKDEVRSFITTLEEQYQQLVAQKKNFLAKYRAELKSQLELLEMDDKNLLTKMREKQ